MAITSELPSLIVIAGATATGKTELAIDLARHIQDAEIVSADSRQVYRGMDIATAKPTPEQQATVPHHGLDLVEPDEDFTAADYRVAALDALAGIAERGRIALLVGGTGLYLRTIARGLPLDQGDTDADIRAGIEARYERDGLESIVAELIARDSEAGGAIDLRNPRRVVRALERAMLTGSARPPAPEGYPAPVAWIGLRRDAVEHRVAIGQRIDSHFEDGLLDEAAVLRSRYPEELAAFSAMGYREAFDVLAGRTDLDTAKATDATRTWSYARRQRTWFRTEPDITWLDAGEGSRDDVVKLLSPFLERVGHAGYAGSG